MIKEKAEPRTIPIETMLDEIYRGQQEIKEALLQIIEKGRFKY